MPAQDSPIGGLIDKSPEHSVRKSAWWTREFCAGAALSMGYIGKPPSTSALNCKGFSAHWQTADLPGRTVSRGPYVGASLPYQFERRKFGLIVCQLVDNQLVCHFGHQTDVLGTGKRPSCSRLSTKAELCGRC